MSSSLNNINLVSSPGTDLLMDPSKNQRSYVGEPNLNEHPHNGYNTMLVPAGYEFPTGALDQVPQNEEEDPHNLGTLFRNIPAGGFPSRGPQVPPSLNAWEFTIHGTADGSVYASGSHMPNIFINGSGVNGASSSNPHGGSFNGGHGDHGSVSYPSVHDKARNQHSGMQQLFYVNETGGYVPPSLIQRDGASGATSFYPPHESEPSVEQSSYPAVFLPSALLSISQQALEAAAGARLPLMSLHQEHITMNSELMSLDQEQNGGEMGGSQGYSWLRNGGNEHAFLPMNEQPQNHQSLFGAQISRYGNMGPVTPDQQVDSHMHEADHFQNDTVGLHMALSLSSNIQYFLQESHELQMNGGAQAGAAQEAAAAARTKELASRHLGVGSSGNADLGRFRTPCRDDHVMGSGSFQQEQVAESDHVGRNFIPHPEPTNQSGPSGTYTTPIFLPESDHLQMNAAAQATAAAARIKEMASRYVGVDTGANADLRRFRIPCRDNHVMGSGSFQQEQVAESHGGKNIMPQYYQPPNQSGPSGTAGPSSTAPRACDTYISLAFLKLAKSLLFEICNLESLIPRKATPPAKPTARATNQQPFGNTPGAGPSSASAGANFAHHGKDHSRSIPVHTEANSGSRDAARSSYPVGHGTPLGADMLQNLANAAFRASVENSREALQDKKAKLILLVHEVKTRYKQYQDQVSVVSAAFNLKAGPHSATPYTIVAQQIMSGHFRTLKDTMKRELKVVRRALGERPADPTELNIGPDASGMGYVDQQIRQQRALQQQQAAMPWRPHWRGLPEPAVAIMRAWLFEHFLHPYPKDADKVALAKLTGLTRSQVSNWFINARVRLWKPMVEEMYTEIQKESTEQAARFAKEKLENSTEAECKEDLKGKAPAVDQ